jgi:hypothetical protein
MKTSIMKYLQSFRGVLGRERFNNFTQDANPPVQLVLLILIICVRRLTYINMPLLYWYLYLQLL